VSDAHLSEEQIRDTLAAYLGLLQRHVRAEEMMWKVLTDDFETGFVGGHMWKGLDGLRDFLPARGLLRRAPRGQGRARPHRALGRRGRGKDPARVLPRALGATVADERRVHGFSLRRPGPVYRLSRHRRRRVAIANPISESRVSSRCTRVGQPDREVAAVQSLRTVCAACGRCACGDRRRRTRRRSSAGRALHVASEASPGCSPTRR
jgi:hypothetical protein